MNFGVFWYRRSRNGRETNAVHVCLKASFTLMSSAICVSVVKTFSCSTFIGSIKNFRSDIRKGRSTTFSMLQNIYWPTTFSEIISLCVSCPVWPPSLLNLASAGGIMANCFHTFYNSSIYVAFKEYTVSFSAIVRHGVSKVTFYTIFYKYA